MAATSGESIVVIIDAELADLIPGYLENRKQDIPIILAALGKGDYDTIRILGHGMKGSGGGYGFHAITDFGRAIEAAAKEGSAEEIRRGVETLGDYLGRIEVVYE